MMPDETHFYTLNTCSLSSKVLSKRFANTKSIALLSSVLLMTGLPMLSHAETTIPSPVSPLATAPIASNTDRNIDNSIDTQIRQTLQNAGIKVPVLSIEPSRLPNMYRVNLDGQPPLHVTADGQYVIQGELQINPSPTVTAPPKEANQPLGNPVSATLRQSLLANMSLLKNMNADTPLYYTAVNGVIWGASGEGVPFLVSDDGKYFSEGEISVIQNGQLTGLDETFERLKNQNVLTQLDDSQLITYPATTAERAVVYVATDINCPYCRRFHRLIPELNAKGVTVKEIGYPVYEESFEPMRQIWCVQDSNQRRQLFEQAMTQDPEKLPLKQCANKQTNLLLGNRKIAAGLSVFATPAIFRADGEIYPANFESPEFLEFLGVQ